MARNHGRLHLLDLNEECQTPLQLARTLGQSDCLALLEDTLDGLMRKHGNSEAAVVGMVVDDRYTLGLTALVVYCIEATTDEEQGHAMAANHPFRRASTQPTFLAGLRSSWLGTKMFDDFDYIFRLWKNSQYSDTKLF